MEIKYNERWFQTFCVSVCMFLFVYALLIFRFSPFSDELWDWSDNANSVYIAAGRFSMALYHSIFNSYGLPVVYGLTAAVFFSLAVVVQTEMLGIVQPLHRFLYTSLCIGLVQFSYLMICCFQADVMCLGILLVSSSYAIISFVAKNWESVDKNRCIALLGVAGIFIAIATGTYQFLLSFPVFFLMAEVLFKPDSKIRRLFIIGIGVTLCATIIYFVLSFFCKLLIDEHVIKYVSGYQDSLITWGLLDFYVHILHIGKQWVLHLLGISYIGEWVYATVLIPFIYLIIKYSKEAQLAKIVAVFILYLIPFIGILLLGEDAGARIHMFEPFSCAVLWCVALKESKINTEKIIFPSVLVYIFSLFVIIKAAYTVTDMAFVQNRMYDRYMLHLNEIKNRIYAVQVPEDKDVYTMPVVVCGKLDSGIEDKYSSCVGNITSSHFNKYMGLENIQNWSRKKLEENRSWASVYAGMPSYPSKGCCQYVDGIILVKLSE